MTVTEKNYVSARKRLIRANLSYVEAQVATRDAAAERTAAENAVYRAEMELEEQVKREAAK